MKKITADFEIIDNTNNSYVGTIEVSNSQTSDVMMEIRNKIKNVYRIGTEQIKSVSNISVEH